MQGDTNEDGQVFNIFAKMIIGVLVCLVGGLYGYLSNDSSWFITASALTVLVIVIGLVQYIKFVRKLNRSFR